MRSVYALVGALVLATSESPLAADFAGPESCKACHPEAYSAWRTSKHARAFESLSAKEKQDARCVTCHAPDQATQQFSSVSCETCHGGGQYYSPDYVMRDAELSRLVGLNDPSEKQCRNCHDASSPSIQPFDFVEKLKLIDHWTAERARRAAPKAPPKKAAPKGEDKKKKTEAPGGYRHHVGAAIASFAAPARPPVQAATK